MRGQDEYMKPHFANALKRVCAGNVNSAATMENSMEVPQKIKNRIAI